MTSCVLFRDYERDWPQLYEAEKTLLLGQIGEHVLTIEHIGSTSVPGLSAKPIIDMLAAIGPGHMPKVRIRVRQRRCGLPTGSI